MLREKLKCITVGKVKMFNYVLCHSCARAAFQLCWLILLGVPEFTSSLFIIGGLIHGNWIMYATLVVLVFLWRPTIYVFSSGQPGLRTFSCLYGVARALKQMFCGREFFLLYILTNDKDYNNKMDDTDLKDMMWWIYTVVRTDKK